MSSTAIIYGLRDPRSCGTAFVSKTKVGKFCGAYCRGKDYRARHGVMANV